MMTTAILPAGAWDLERACCEGAGCAHCPRCGFTSRVWTWTRPVTVGDPYGRVTTQTVTACREHRPND